MDTDQLRVSQSRAVARARRSAWPPSSAEARAHAWVLTGVLWTAAAANFFGTSGRIDLFGNLKGTDFVHLYTLGTVTRERTPEALYDVSAIRARQVALVPESAPFRYIPVYPPQAGVLLAPFAGWPYEWALTVWTLFTVSVYAGVMAIVTRGVALQRSILIPAISGFPPFWHLVMNGQSTALPLLAFGLGGAALLAGRAVVAGALFGLLAIKPQFGLVLAVVVLACREWRILGGIALAWAAQFAIVSAVDGYRVWSDYAGMVASYASLRPLLVPKPVLMHSLTSLVQPLPMTWQMWAWLVLSAPVIVETVRLWRSAAALEFKLAVLVIASVQVNPQLAIYDATVLALPLLSIAARWQTRPPRASVAFVYALVITLLIPTAGVIGVQVSVIVMIVLFYRVRFWSRAKRMPATSLAPGAAESANP